ncbi:hypothetical protein RJ641_024187 [Dillenia turbinata]|uniref:MAR-binding filament-like protein 1-1 n=1 Tax=Dillenia turbinata TaxID=194707 RepID=A0AAN8UG05_9MAGN
MASMRHENIKDLDSNKRRAILLVGISVLPLLRFRAKAADEFVAYDRNTKISDVVLVEVSLVCQKQEAQPDPILSLLNGIGVFSSGVIGALYALARKERTATEAALETVKSKLKDKEAAIVSQEKNFERKLLNEQEERTVFLRKAKEEQQALLDKLNSANSTITGLGYELQREKKSAEELQLKMEGIQTDLKRAGENKKVIEEHLKEKLDTIEVLQERINLLSLEIMDRENTIQNLKSSLNEKDSEFNKLTSTFKQTKDELAEATSAILGLKEELLISQEELQIRNSRVDNLKAQVGSLIVERDDANRRTESIQNEYNDLKLSSDEKAALDAKLLGERESEINQLKERLEVAQNQVKATEAVNVGLIQERDDLKKSLNLESNNLKNLKEELLITQESLGKSRNEASDLSTQLNESTKLLKELEIGLSKARAEHSEVTKSLQKNLEEARQGSEALAGELTAVQSILKKAQDELQIVSNELAAVVDNRENLKTQLLDVCKKAENAVTDLKEEKKVVAALNKELQALEKMMDKDKEARRSLETELEEAKKSLDEMNRDALILSRDIEMAKARISTLEDEKDVIYRTLVEQKNLSQVAQENMEDAHNLVMRLGQERETLDKRVKRLEEELAAAKGEILRLRSRIYSSKTIVNDQHQHKREVSQIDSSERVVNNQHQLKDEAETTPAVPGKRVNRRRRAGP